MSSDIATRVAKGVALLDEQVPGWDGHIDLIKLDVKSTDRCVLGQVFGNYSEGCDRLGLWEEEETHQTHPVLYGFEITEERWYRSADQQYFDLTQEWIRVLTVLRQKHETQERETVTA